MGKQKKKAAASVPAASKPEVSDQVVREEEETIEPKVSDKARNQSIIIAVIIVVVIFGTWLLIRPSAETKQPTSSVPRDSTKLSLQVFPATGPVAEEKLIYPGDTTTFDIHLSWRENTRLMFQTTQPLLVIYRAKFPGKKGTEEVARLVTVDEPYFYVRGINTPLVWPDNQPMRIALARRGGSDPEDVVAMVGDNPK